VPVLPLAQSSGLDAALAPLGRATRYVGAALALGALAVQSGVEDAIVVSLGREMTDVCVLRDGVPIGARSFSIGAASFDRRPDGGAPADAEVWARCVALSASDAAGTIALPARVLLGTDAVRAAMLTSALQEAIARRLPAGGGTVTALMPAVVGGIASETPLDVADLAAIAAACV